MVAVLINFCAMHDSDKQITLSDETEGVLSMVPTYELFIIASGLNSLLKRRTTAYDRDTIIELNDACIRILDLRLRP